MAVFPYPLPSIVVDSAWAEVSPEHPVLSRVWCILFFPEFAALQGNPYFDLLQRLWQEDTITMHIPLVFVLGMTQYGLIHIEPEHS